MRVALLADHPEHIATLARWHCEHDGKGDDERALRFWRIVLRRESGRRGIPIAFVALDDNVLLGAVSLVANNMSTHPELSPWLAGTFVHESHRGKGVGAKLVEHAVAHAKQLGVKRLYLYTEHARRFYEKLGWVQLFHDRYESKPVTVMAIDLAKPIVASSGVFQDVV